MRAFGAAQGPLQPVRPVQALLLALMATAVVCYPAWPGYTSYDSFRAFDEARGGVTSAIWPPMHAYLFRVSLWLRQGLGGLFAFQTYVLFAGAFLTIQALTARAGWGALLCLGFLATFAWIPPQLGVLVTHWRDVTMTSFAVLALGVWAASARRRFEPGVIAAALLFGIAAALRHNGLALVLPPMLLMIARPFLTAGEGPGRRGRVVAAVVLSLAAAIASDHWRLPDLRPIVTGRLAVTTQAFDLIGVSACASRVYLPPAMTRGQVVTPADARAIYDPRHVNMSLGGPALPGLGRPAYPITLHRVTPRDGAEVDEVEAAWRRAVLSEPACYLHHRLAVFREQMGLAADHVFAPVHGVMHPNPYGLRLAHPDASDRLVRYVLARSSAWPQRAIWLYVLAAGLVGVAALRAAPGRALLLSGLFGAFAYAGSWLLVGPAADARYIFPANTLCALLALAAVGALTAGEARRRRF